MFPIYDQGCGCPDHHTLVMVSGGPRGMKSPWRVARRIAGGMARNVIPETTLVPWGEVYAIQMQNSGDLVRHSKFHLVGTVVK